MDHDGLSILSDYYFDGAATIQKYWQHEVASTKVAWWKPYIILRASRRKGAMDKVPELHAPGIKNLYQEIPTLVLSLTLLNKLYVLLPYHH